MVLTGLCFVGVTASVKLIGGRVPAAQAAFLRYALGLIFVLPMVSAMFNTRLGRRDWAFFGLRGVVHSIGVMLWFAAMARLTITELTALNYLTPTFVTLGAVLFLGEKLAFRRFAALVIAFVGALVILRPGFRELGGGHLAMLCATLFLGMSYLLAKRLTSVAHPSVVVGLLSVTVPIGLAPFAFAVWVTPAWSDVAWLLLVAAFATAGHYTMTLAFRAAPLSVTQPVVFLQLVWAVLMGLAFFNEPLDLFAIAGGTVIIAAVSFIAWREAQLKGRAQAAPEETPTKL